MFSDDEMMGGHGEIWDDQWGGPREQGMPGRRAGRGRHGRDGMNLFHTGIKRDFREPFSKSCHTKSFSKPETLSCI